MKTRERVELSAIDDNPWQPRKDMDPEALDKMAASIAQIGLLQAPLARPHPEVSGRYQLAFGHQRVASLRLLHKRGDYASHVDMDVEGLSDERMAVIALTENVQRKDLSQMETLRGYRKALDETELTATALAKQLDIADSTLSNNLRVLELPDFILEHVESGDLGMTVAREFLALQNATHAHHEDMREVVRRIVNEARDRPPNWRRKNVRKLIAERVSFQEQAGFRPIGPKTGHEVGGGNREATFDTDAFAFEFADCLHTIPADDGSLDREHYRAFENYDKSRVWTCEVKEWSRRQSRATREANAAATVGGGNASGRNAAKAPSRDKVFESLLANDPVFGEIIFSREKEGPKRPVNDDERERMGTRAEFRDVDYHTKFYKILYRGGQENLHSHLRLDGGLVPPWFPDLKECRSCTIGAAYAKSSGGYPLNRPALVCFNKDHYLEKLARGEAAYREKLQANVVGADRRDQKAAARFRREIQPLSDDACRALAITLAAAKRGLDLQHPMGEFHEAWSHESGIVVSIRELLGAAPPKLDRWNKSGPVLDVDAVTALPVEHIRELVPLLMAHHLGVAGKVEELLETPEAEPANESTETKRCTCCGQDKSLDAFGQQKRNRRDGRVEMVPKAKCKECLVNLELERRAAKTPAEVAA